MKWLVSQPGAPIALASAMLFGASTPLAKLLLGQAVSPWVLAGLLYLGSGFGLGVVLSLRAWGGATASEAPLRRSDLPWLALVVLCGGVVGPLLLMVGLQRTSGSAASLLLNVEGLATMTIAWVAFRENVDRRLLLGAGAILLGALTLSWQSGPSNIGVGALAVVGACIAWGVDNNLTRKLSSADPAQIAAVKGIAAGATNLTLALALGARLPTLELAAAAGIVGLLGYGVSLVLFILALRHLGSARTGAYFSTAPFLGALLSLALLGDAPTPRLAVAGLLMAIGVYLHLAERHEHSHTHEAFVHEHRHVHDEHHQHEHRADDRRGEPHSHWHRHNPMTHSHAHYPDLHHRHEHG